MTDPMITFKLGKDENLRKLQVIELDSQRVTCMKN
jgi:hypothetical protein